MQARRLFQGLWGAGQMSFTKILAALDPDVEVRDGAAAARALLDRARIPGSLVFTEGVLDALDHASPSALWGGKLGIDATRSVPGEPGHGEPLSPPEDLPAEAAILAALQGSFPGLRSCRTPVRGTRLGLVLLVLRKARPGEGGELSRAAVELPGVHVAVAVEGEGDEELPRLVWRALASLDPARDVRVVGDRLAVDATFKGAPEGHPRPWPAEVSHPEEILRAVEPVARRLGLTRQEP